MEWKNKIKGQEKKKRKKRKLSIKRERKERKRINKKYLRDIIMKMGMKK
jgi:hypothetical protein